ncbi:hypothetical protein HMPREF1871_00211 [Gemelliphila asaccharolytica]|uniref:Methyl-accepting chemotaxis protein n=2 Tax=Gemelliphila asaccharolytica TaxID=502393 RepID=A0ABR5TNQ2_9BACL|nr:hypothetical protein HMPREF1871_00211 [Gemella asaccharolytica]
MKTFMKNNKGSAILISILTLVLVSIVIFSVANIYINKIKSLKSINDYYDIKIKEQIIKNKIKS